MSIKIYQVFEEVQVKAQLLTKYWDNFYTEISQHLPDRYQRELLELSDNLEIAIDKLIDELRNPTLTLATTGTTSSGKSTLVNLLCGAEIVPVAVSEMSAGAVTVEYSDEKSLEIHETPGALWECGKWTGITDERIYQRLHDVMISYIDNREKQLNLACPQSTITYPFRLIKESKLELPRGVKVKIMDLPGLAHVGDKGNANVIKQCREALCLVTYNSAETDKEKVKNLLEEVVQQVRDLGGSPARMLFILNRIDVFRADKNYPETEKRFVENAIQSIKLELSGQLKEYTTDIEKLTVVKLSTWPALLALQMKSDETYSVEACKKADNYFNGLIDEDILEDLPRKVEKWSVHDRNRVADALWKKSYAEDFQQHLKDHISQHFPRLVIPQAIERFNIGAGNAITEWAIQTTTAIINSSEKQYKEECEKIGWIRSALDSFLQESDKNLREPFEEIDKKIKQVLAGESEDDPVLFLENSIKNLNKVEAYNELGDKLCSLYEWRRGIGKGINQVLETVAKSLETGKVVLDTPNLKKANVSSVNLLGYCLKRLINLGYTGSVAKSGKKIEARTEDEKKKLKELNENLNELATHLNLVMQDVLKQISSQELDRMYQAVVELFKCHLSHIEKGTNNIAPNLAIKFPDSQLIRVDSKPTFNLSFKAGFAVTSGTWKEAIQVEKTKRNWYTLWIVEQKYSETEYKTRSSDNAEIPSTEKLLENWQFQIKTADKEIVTQISRWLLEQIDSLGKNVDKVQNDILNRYQERLDTANREITIDYEMQQNVWLPMQQKANSLIEDFNSLSKPLKEEL
ncbi:MAG: dynamin family protein [Nostoc sp. DcaGUA01]|nr:dynamin family protein [Nostoc sp. DcaGUA01]